ncbi:VOC family protein [Plantactinospora sp. WMMB782]|uniref:VOC family protein n=1 Tax=Plantactinospora sp. WMMB782 TaxID=3404121 RepID=UPI003B9652A2
MDPDSSPSTELVLWCEDSGAFYRQAMTAGATSVVAPMDSPDGRLHYAWVRDPDGHQVKFVQKR